MDLNSIAVLVKEFGIIPVVIIVLLIVFWQWSQIKLDKLKQEQKKPKRDTASHIFFDQAGWSISDNLDVESGFKKLVATDIISIGYRVTTDEIRKFVMMGRIDKLTKQEFKQKLIETINVADQYHYQAMIASHIPVQVIEYYRETRRSLDQIILAQIEDICETNGYTTNDDRLWAFLTAMNVTLKALKSNIETSFKYTGNKFVGLEYKGFICQSISKIAITRHSLFSRIDLLLQFELPKHQIKNKGRNAIFHRALELRWKNFYNMFQSVASRNITTINGNEFSGLMLKEISNVLSETDRQLLNEGMPQVVIDKVNLVLNQYNQLILKSAEVFGSDIIAGEEALWALMSVCRLVFEMGIPQVRQQIENINGELKGVVFRGQECDATQTK